MDVLRDDGWMSRTLKVITAAMLVGVGAAGAVVFLSGQGLDRAEQWVSIIGMVVSVALAAGGVVLGWLAWRHPHTTTPATPAVEASGAGAAAVGGNNRGAITTNVTNPAPGSPPAGASAGGAVRAGGAGAAAVGGDNTAPISTRVTGPGAQPTGGPTP